MVLCSFEGLFYMPQKYVSVSEPPEQMICTLHILINIASLCTKYIVQARTSRGYSPLSVN